MIIPTSSMLKSDTTFNIFRPPFFSLKLGNESLVEANNINRFTTIPQHEEPWYLQASPGAYLEGKY